MYLKLDKYAILIFRGDNEYTLVILSDICTLLIIYWTNKCIYLKLNKYVIFKGDNEYA
jgi:hypothetical protein